MSLNTTADYHLSLFKRPPGRRPFVLGHRGAPRLAPENTLASFYRALEEGADGVELDVRMSADGQLIIAHDDEVQVPGARAPLALHRLTLSQIQALPLSHGEPIPTLREVLCFQASTGARLNIELKGNVPAPSWMARAAATQIRTHGGANILVSSFSPAIVFILSRVLPDVPRGLLFNKDQIWMQRVLPLTLVGAHAAHPQENLLNPSFARRIREKVPLLITWMVNDPARAIELAKMGVDTVITDEPALIRKALA